MSLGSFQTGQATKPKPPSTSMVKLARKRVGDVNYLGDRVFRVAGRDDLNDAYPEYIVRDFEEGRHCSCQDHPGGQYRPRCSHKLAAVFYKAQEGIEYDVHVEPAEQAPTQVEDEAPAEPLGLVPEPSDSHWGSPPLPEKFTKFFPHQERAIRDILAAFERGYTHVFVDAPTGSGKTLIGETVRRGVGGKALYTCSTKGLQDQFLEDFDYAKVLKGRSNYPTEHGPRWVTCDDCTLNGGNDCRWCSNRHTCPYRCAKNAAVTSPIAVVNTAYALAEMSNEDRSQLIGRDLVIVDECDLLEQSLMSWVEIRISERQQKKLRIDPPEVKGRNAKSNDWLEWCQTTISKVRDELSRLPTNPQEPKMIRQVKYVGSLLIKLSVLRDGLIDEDGTDWVYTGYERGNDIIFKPVKVDQLAGDALWSKSKRWLLMSASIISAGEMAESLGIPDDAWTVVNVPSTFPPENRPIYRAPVANVTSKTWDHEVPKLIDAVATIMDEHPNEAILVHTVSYRLSKELFFRLRERGYASRLMRYDDGTEREESLAEFKRRSNPVMLAPSLDRGVDLPDDQCRVQVIAKVPYPYLGDKQVKARMYTKGGQTWFRVQTIRTMVQMTGRGVRHENDHCVTYILDKQFNKLWRKKRLFPKWWRNGVDNSGYALRMLRGA